MQFHRRGATGVGKRWNHPSVSSMVGEVTELHLWLLELSRRHGKDVVKSDLGYNTDTIATVLLRQNMYQYLKRNDCKKPFISICGYQRSPCLEEMEEV